MAKLPRVGLFGQAGMICVQPRGREGTGEVAIALDLPDAMDLAYQIIGFYIYMACGPNASTADLGKLLDAQALIADVVPTIYSGRDAPEG